MSDLPVLKPIDPVAICGFCDNAIYPDGRCQNPAPQPNACPLKGGEWRALKLASDMRNTFVRGAALSAGKSE